MRKKTKQLIAKITVGLSAVLAGGFFLFGQKDEKKEVTKKPNENDKNLFI